MRPFNKYILAIALISASSCILFSADIPKPKGFVSDYAGVLSEEKSAELDSKLQELEAKTSAEVAVVIIKNLEGQPIEDYTMRLAESWKVGKKGKDNGILFLVSVEDKHARIEVGYGLEGILPDSKCGEILRAYVVTNFNKNDFESAVVSATTAIIDEVYKEYGVNPGGTESTAAQKGPRRRNLSATIFGLLFAAVWMIGILADSRRRLKGGKRYGSGYYGGFGGFGGGFGGGGFGGFGGGGFGGGGSSV